MTCKELIEYLSQFAPEERVSALILNLETRLAYKVDGYQLMTDAGMPVMLFELGASEPLDDVLEEANP